MNSRKIKVGSKVRILRDLPVNDPDFRSSSPGWIDEMDKILGKWGVITRIEPTCYEASFGALGKWYISDEYIDMGANPLYAEKVKMPELGDWAVYYESIDDREIATIGKVTSVNKDELSWGIDGIDGYRNVYKFEGDVSLIDKVRNGEI